jgi:PH (Pleckstrin Homology) domain-containing protein
MPRYTSTHVSGQQSQMPAELARELSGDERVLWYGRPLAGVRLRGSDALGIPFSLLWGGFAIFWETLVIRQGAPLLFLLWGIPFVAVGLYLIAGRFFFDAWRRSRTAYAVTSERVFIVSGGLRPSVITLRLATLPAVSLSERRAGVGTISFGSGSGLAAAIAGMQGWPGAARQLGPQLELLPNARSVYETIQEAQRDATRR